jgi:heme A synthase
MTEPQPTSSAPEAPALRRARSFARAVVATTLVVLAAGATVTSTASGDAVPTWPWGWFSEQLAVNIEMSHRVVAGVLVAGTLALVWIAYRTKDPSLRRIAWAAFWLALVQALVGGLRIYVATWFLKVVHATLAQVFFCVAVAAAAVTSRWWRETRQRPLEDAGLAMLRASGFALAALFVQLVLGALGRHDVIPREVHAVFALPALVLVARIVLVASGDLPRDVELFRGPTALLGLLAGVQLVLGIAAYIVAMDVPDPLQRGAFHSITLAAHLAVGAAMMGLVLTILLRTVRLWGLPTDERVAEARGPAAPAGEAAP